MYHFTFNKKSTGFDVAQIQGGVKDGSILKITEQKPTDKIEKELLYEDYSKELNIFKPRERMRVLAQLQKAFNSKNSEDLILDEKVQEVFKTVKQKEFSHKTVELEDGLFVPVIRKDKHFVYYIAGVAGAGKSYLCGELLKSYKKLYPKRECYLISKLNQDDTLDKLKFLKRIDISTFLESPPDISEFANSVCVFDDYENLDKNVLKIVINLINDICIEGRHHNSDCILINHLLTNYKQSRISLSEATHVVVYPSSSSFQSLKYLLTNYIGLNKKEIEEIRKLKTRWVIIYRHAPNYILTQTSVKLLN